jgi:hypothetical protein
LVAQAAVWRCGVEWSVGRAGGLLLVRWISQVKAFFVPEVTPALPPGHSGPFDAPIGRAPIRAVSEIHLAVVRRIYRDRLHVVVIEVARVENPFLIIAEEIPSGPR